MNSPFRDGKITNKSTRTSETTDEPFVYFKGPNEVFPNFLAPNKDLCGFSPVSINQGYFQYTLENGELVIEKRAFKSAGYGEKFDLLFEALSKLTKYCITVVPLLTENGQDFPVKLYYINKCSPMSFFDRRCMLSTNIDGTKTITRYSPCVIFAWWAERKSVLPSDMIKLIVSFVSS